MFSCLTFGSKSAEDASKQSQPAIAGENNEINEYNNGVNPINAIKINPQLVGTPDNFQIPIVPNCAQIIELGANDEVPEGAVPIELAPAGFVPIVPKNYNQSAHITVGDVSRIEGGSPTDPCDIALNNYLAFKNIQYTVKKVADREYQFHGFAHAVIFLNERGYLCALYQDANGSQIISIDDVMKCVQALIDEHVRKVETEAIRLAEQEALAATALNDKAPAPKTSPKKIASAKASPKAKTSASPKRLASTSPAKKSTSTLNTPSRTATAASKTVKTPGSTSRSATGTAAPKAKAKASATTRR